MTDIDAPLVKQVYDISKRKRKTHIHHHSQTDDFGRGFECLTSAISWDRFEDLNNGGFLVHLID